MVLSKSTPRCSSAAAIHEFRHPPDDQRQERMRDGAKVAESKGSRFASGAFVAFDWNFEVTNAAIQQPRDQVGLETKAVRIRVPAHDIITASQRQTVVVTNVVAAGEVNEPGKSLGDQLPQSR